MGIAIAHTLERTVRPAAQRSSTGQFLLQQVKFAAVAYPSLVVVVFLGAVGAAYINPHLMDRVQVERPAPPQPMATQPPTILTPQPMSTVPVEPPQGASEPLISMFGTSRPTTSTPVSIVNHGDAIGAAMATGTTKASAAAVAGEQCEPQRTADGHYLGRTCTPIPATPAAGGR